MPPILKQLLKGAEVFKKINPQVLAAVLAASTCSLPDARAQMVTGSAMQDFDRVFKVESNQREYAFSATFVKSSVPGNVLFPGESGSWTFQIINNGDAPIKTAARVEMIPYGTRGLPGDIWKPQVFSTPNLQPSSTPIAVDLKAKGFQNITVSPRVPARLGGYALVVDLGVHGRQFVTSFVRTFKATSQRIQYPKMSLDHLDDAILKRLGVQAIRMGVDYIPSDDQRHAEWKANLDAQMKALKANNITALVMWGTGHRKQPLGRGRPHLDADNVLLGGKEIWRGCLS
jgi:hypothetical protein